MVKIYIFELTSPIRDKDKPSLLSKLDKSELKIFSHHQKKRLGFSLIGHILAKKIVSDEISSPQKNVLIGKTKLGKPIIRKPSDLNFEISISHSGSYFVIGICDKGKIGVDIELLNDFDFGVLKNCLSASEEMYVNLGKENRQRIENFYEIWTRKEAYLKALGTGLQKPLPIMQFYPDHTTLKAEIRHNNQQYYISTLKEDKFILSICTTRSIEYFQSYTRLSPENLLSFAYNSKITRSSVKNQ